MTGEVLGFELYSTGPARLLFIYGALSRVFAAERNRPSANTAGDETQSSIRSKAFSIKELEGLRGLVRGVQAIS